MLDLQKRNPKQKVYVRARRYVNGFKMMSGESSMFPNFDYRISTFLVPCHCQNINSFRTLCLHFSGNNFLLLFFFCWEEFRLPLVGSREYSCHRRVWGPCTTKPFPPYL